MLQITFGIRVLQVKKQNEKFALLLGLPDSICLFFVVFF